MKRNFKREIDYFLIAAQNKQIIYSRPDNQTLWYSTKKMTCWIIDFAVPAEHRVRQKESKNIAQYLDIARELKKYMEHESYC